MKDSLLLAAAVQAVEKVYQLDGDPQIDFQVLDSELWKVKGFATEASNRVAALKCLEKAGYVVDAKVSKKSTQKTSFLGKQRELAGALFDYSMIGALMSLRASKKKQLQGSSFSVTYLSKALQEVAFSREYSDISTVIRLGLKTKLLKSVSPTLRSWNKWEPDLTAELQEIANLLLVDVVSAPSSQEKMTKTTDSNNTESAPSSSPVPEETPLPPGEKKSEVKTPPEGPPESQQFVDSSCTPPATLLSPSTTVILFRTQKPDQFRAILQHGLSVIYDLAVYLGTQVQNLNLALFNIIPSIDPTRPTQKFCDITFSFIGGENLTKDFLSNHGSKLHSSVALPPVWGTPAENRFDPPSQPAPLRPPPTPPTTAVQNDEAHDDIASRFLSDPETWIEDALRNGASFRLKGPESIFDEFKRSLLASYLVRQGVSEKEVRKQVIDHAAKEGFLIPSSTEANGDIRYRFPKDLLARQHRKWISVCLEDEPDYLRGLAAFPVEKLEHFLSARGVQTKGDWRKTISEALEVGVVVSVKKSSSPSLLRFVSPDDNKSAHEAKSVGEVGSHHSRCSSSSDEEYSRQGIPAESSQTVTVASEQVNVGNRYEVAREEGEGAREDELPVCCCCSRRGRGAERLNLNGNTFALEEDFEEGTLRLCDCKQCVSLSNTSDDDGVRGRLFCSTCYPLAHAQSEHQTVKTVVETKQSSRCAHCSVLELQYEVMKEKFIQEREEDQAKFKKVEAAMNMLKAVLAKVNTKAELLEDRLARSEERRLESNAKLREEVESLKRKNDDLELELSAFKQKEEASSTKREVEGAQKNVPDLLEPFSCGICDVKSTPATIRSGFRRCHCSTCTAFIFTGDDATSGDGLLLCVDCYKEIHNEEEEVDFEEEGTTQSVTGQELKQLKDTTPSGEEFEGGKESPTFQLSAEAPQFVPSTMSASAKPFTPLPSYLSGMAKKE